VVPTNPTAVVRGPKHVVKTGKTPVLEGSEWRKLLKSIPTTTLRDLRDRALIATLTYSFARITAALKMKVEDLQPRGALTAGTSWIEPSIPRETTKVSRERRSCRLCFVVFVLHRRSLRTFVPADHVLHWVPFNLN
jgi:hypothetical protein